MGIQFKDVNGNMMYSETETGYSRAIEGSEGLSDDKNWYKLDDFAASNGLCDSIDRIYTLLLKQKDNLNILKNNLESLKESWNGIDPICTVYSCNAAPNLINLKSHNIVAIDTQIATIDIQISIIDQQIEILCYMKPDNMYFRRDKK